MTQCKNGKSTAILILRGIMDNNVLIGPVFSLKNLEAHIGNLDKDTWDEIQKFQSGMKADADGVIKEFNVKVSESKFEAAFARERVLLGNVVFREYTRLDRVLFPVFRFFGNIINRLRGL